ncbi:MAG: Nif3-like dinuclear metal center hexameric protein [Planctomycetota bacterium]
MKLQTLLDVMNTIAPRSLAASWDNVGLLIGTPDDPIEGPVVLTIDLTPTVVDEAIEKSASAVIAYHPPIFQPIAAISDATPRSAALLRLIRSGAAVYSPHTALDASKNGMAEWLLRSCAPGEINSIRALEPHTPTARAFKIVTFVPSPHLDALRIAMSNAGAGIIGNYTHCSFSLDGTGTFLGNESTNPTIGQRGQLESVSEARLEMATPHHSVHNVVEALRSAHPYEEPAFDLYPLEAAHDPELGSGRIGKLSTLATTEELITSTHESLGVPVKAALAQSQDAVYSIAVCPGAGSSLLNDAKRAGADAFITGEMSHHDVLHATLDLNMHVLLAGHTNTERPYLCELRKRLSESISGIDFEISESDRSPLAIRGI